MRWIARSFRLTLRLLRFGGLLALMLFLLQYSSVPFGQPWAMAALLARDWQFDYVGWEVNALAVKARQTLWGLHPFMTELDRSAFVRAYMADLAAAQRLESAVSALYADPAVADPSAASAELRAERDALRRDLAARQPLAEAILEGQVAAVLVEQGFGLAGQILPPIAMHFTQVPNLLVISPRDEIRFDISINLYSMPVDEQAALEDAIDEALDVASLIVPLGGIALYPAMILETTSISFALDTFAHEWLHHYLYFFPLGLEYDFASETRIINETTATLFGREMSQLVLERYYPDLLPPPSAPTPSEAAPAPPQRLSPPAFDFGAAMHETRVTVDALLAAGDIEGAEAYMEERRRLFVANGFPIRKLNQAYFAFYGGYQTGAPGAGGQDPIGPAVRALREASPSLHDWVVTMRTITTREALLAAARMADGT
ncbi:MAG: hypothetical protein SNJ59_16670 [Aggregatilineales bacterium]